MQEPFGARPFAMGQAYTALGDDIFGMSYNPASLSRLRQSEVATQYSQSVLDTTLGYLGFATPLNPTQALGLSVFYLDAGKIDLFDDSGNIYASGSAQRDFMMQLGYAHSFYVPTPFSSISGRDEGARLHVGAAGKVLRSALFQGVSATGYAGDIGGIYEAPLPSGSLSIGAAVSNLGPGLKYSGGIAGGSQADPLPLTSRVGLGFKKNLFAADTISVGVEGDRVSADNNTFAGFGVEYLYHQLFSLRAGYRGGQDTGGLTFGLGLSFKDFSIDYGVGLMQTFSSVQHISLAYRFSIPGIRYSEASPPSPLESMVDHVRANMAAGRFFEARDEAERIQTFFPDSGQAAILRQEIDGRADRLTMAAPEVNPNTLDAKAPVDSSAQFNYSLGYRKYYAGEWQEAAAALERALRAQPGNKEIESYWRKAGKNAEDARRQQELERGARIATLFELANDAFTERDYARSRRIVQEILRLGPYEPASDLARRINSAMMHTKPAPRPHPQAGEGKTNPPLPEGEGRVRAPTAQDIDRAEDLYYEALRDYGENRMEVAVEKLRRGLQLNPASDTIRTTLNDMEKQLKRLQRAGAGP